MKFFSSLVTFSLFALPALASFNVEARDDGAEPLEVRDPGYGSGYRGGYRGGYHGGYRGGWRGGHGGGWRHGGWKREPEPEPEPQHGGYRGGYHGGYRGGYRHGGYRGGYRHGGYRGGYRHGGYRHGGYRGMYRRQDQESAPGPEVAISLIRIDDALNRVNGWSDQVMQAFQAFDQQSDVSNGVLLFANLNNLDNTAKDVFNIVQSVSEQTADSLPVAVQARLVAALEQVAPRLLEILNTQFPQRTGAFGRVGEWFLNIMRNEIQMLRTDVRNFMQGIRDKMILDQQLRTRVDAFIERFQDVTGDMNTGVTPTDNASAPQATQTDMGNITQ